MFDKLDFGLTDVTSQWSQYMDSESSEDSSGSDYDETLVYRGFGYHRSFGIEDIMDPSFYDDYCVESFSPEHPPVLQIPFFAYRDETKEDSDGGCLVRMTDEEYAAACSGSLGVLDASYAVMSDSLVARYLWSECRVTREKPTLFDKVRAAYHRMGTVLVPSGKFLNYNQQRVHTLKDIVCTFFEIPSCHSIKISKDAIVAYTSSGVMSRGNVAEFAQIISDYLPLENHKDEVEVFNLDDPEVLEGLTFVEFFHCKYGINLAAYEKFLPSQLNKSNWTPEVQHISRFFENMGDSIVLQYAVRAFMPKFTDISSWSQLRGALVSNHNLALNAIMAGWNVFFHDNTGGYLSLLADVFETVLGILYDYYEYDTFKVCNFLDEMDFSYYRGGVGNVENAVRLAAEVNKAVSKGRRLLYSFPYATIYDLKLDFIKRIRLCVSPVEGISSIKAPPEGDVSLLNVRSVLCRVNMFSTVPQESVYELESKKLDKLASAVRVSRSGTLSLALTGLSSSDKDLSESYDDDDPRDSELVVGSFIQVDYRDYVEEGNSSDHVSLLYQKVSADLGYVDFTYEKDVATLAHLPLFKAQLRIVRMGDEIGVTCYGAPSKQKGKRVLSAVAINEFY